MTTWRKLIAAEMKQNKDGFHNLVYSFFGTAEKLTWEGTFTEPVTYDREFDDGFGGSNGGPFTVWTKDFVYFPVVYDGAEWVGSVPRNPCDIATEHVGSQ